MDADLGEGRDQIVEAFQMLDVERRINVDAGIQQFFDVLIAFVVTASGRVRMRQFIDQHQCRLAMQDRVDIHLVEPMALMIGRLARDDFEALNLGFRLLTSVGFDHPDDHIYTGVPPSGSIGQHFIGLPYTRRRPEKQLEAALAFARGSAQQRVGIGAGVGHRPYFARGGATLSSARLSSSTFTRGSPKKPSSAPST